MNECRVYKEANGNHFMTKRFDRVKGQKLHMQTLGAIGHIDYNDPGLCSYEQAAGYMRQMNLPAIDIEQLFRRMVFNVIAVNQDDHVKNISFLMDKSGSWRLSPAYDITFSYDATNRWLSAHQMRINEKRKDITYEDILEAGRSMEISTARCKHIIREVEYSVRLWTHFAEECGIKNETIELIEKEMIKNCL